MVYVLMRVTILLQLVLLEHFLIVQNWSLYVLKINIYFLCILKYVLVCLLNLPYTLSFFLLQSFFKFNCFLLDGQLIVLFREYVIILIASFTFQYHIWILCCDFEMITFIKHGLLLDRLWEINIFFIWNVA
jgi:hypothetical protein